MKRKALIQIPAVLTVALLLIFPDISASGAEYGLKLWTQRLIPSLFPFMCASAMLTYSGVMDKITSAVGKIAGKAGLHPAFAGAFVAGVISGFPSGAAAVKDAVKRDGRLKDDAKSALWYCTFASPVFVMNTVGEKLLGDRKAGIAILIADYISFAILFFIFVRKKYDNRYMLAKDTAEKISVGGMLRYSISSAVTGIVFVGGCTVIFSVLLSMLEAIPQVRENSVLLAVISAFVEVSNGTAAASAMNAPFGAKTALAAFAVSWGGLSVNAQIAGYADECEAFSYFFVKMGILHGITAAALAPLILCFMNKI